MQIDTVLMAEPAAAADQARVLADLGFDGVFAFEGIGDVFVPLTLAAAATDLTVYSNVAIAFPRSPMHLAYTAWDLQKLSGGRFMLGLGTQVRANIERRFSSQWSRPVERMTELVEATKAIFRCWQDGERLDFRGEFYTFTLMQPTFNPGPNPFGPPPILVGALGPKLTRAVASTADGLLLHPFMTERFVHERTLVEVDRGLSESGRQPRRLLGRGHDHRLHRPRRGRARRRRRGHPRPAGLLRLDPRLQAGARRARLGRPATRAEHPLEAGPVGRDGRAHRRRDALDAGGAGRAGAVATEIERRFGDVADRVGFYLPYGIDPAALVEVRAGFG